MTVFGSGYVIDYEGQDGRMGYRCTFNTGLQFDIEVPEAMTLRRGPGESWFITAEGLSWCRQEAVRQHLARAAAANLTWVLKDLHLVELEKPDDRATMQLIQVAVIGSKVTYLLRGHGSTGLGNYRRAQWRAEIDGASNHLRRHLSLIYTQLLPKIEAQFGRQDNEIRILLPKRQWELPLNADGTEPDATYGGTVDLVELSEKVRVEAKPVTIKVPLTMETATTDQGGVVPILRAGEGMSVNRETGEVMRVSDGMVIGVTLGEPDAEGVVTIALDTNEQRAKREAETERRRREAERVRQDRLRADARAEAERVREQRRLMEAAQPPPARFEAQVQQRPVARPTILNDEPNTVRRWVTDEAEVVTPRPPPTSRPTQQARRDVKDLTELERKRMLTWLEDLCEKLGITAQEASEAMRVYPNFEDDTIEVRTNDGKIVSRGTMPLCAALPDVMPIETYSSDEIAAARAGRPEPVAPAPAPALSAPEAPPPVEEMLLDLYDEPVRGGRTG